MEPEYVFNLFLVGPRGVGRQSLTDRFIDDKFEADIPATIGIEFKHRGIELDGAPIKLRIWMRVGYGSERFRAIEPKRLYRNCHGAAVLYDCTSDGGIQRAEEWLAQAVGYVNENVPVVLVGTKCDLEERRQVSKTDGEALAAKYNVPFLEVSAKDNINVDRLFIDLSVRALDGVKNGRVAYVPPPVRQPPAADPAPGENSWCTIS